MTLVSEESYITSFYFNIKTEVSHIVYALCISFHKYVCKVAMEDGVTYAKFTSFGKIM